MRMFVLFIFQLVVVGNLYAQLTVEERKQQAQRFSIPAHSNFLAETGGMIDHPITNNRSVVILDIRKKKDGGGMGTFPSEITQTFRLPVETRHFEAADAMMTAAEFASKKEIVAVIVLCDSPSFPSLLVAPENRWAIVNVRSLKATNMSEKVLDERVQKELWRTFGYLMGAANSNMPICLMKPIFSLEELDALKARRLSPEPFNKIMLQASKLGVLQPRPTTYRKACEEGWAPMPTNSIQKAIWEEVKAKKK